MARGDLRVRLTRKELDAIMLYVSLNSNVESVAITQHSGSGIGLTTMVHYTTPDSVITQDITDVESW